MANPINNEVHISLFTGLSLSENLNVVIFYECSVQNTYNPKRNHKPD
jgi:hypothetical protein